MPDRVFHQFFEVRGVARHAFVRTLKDHNLIRHDEAIGHTAVGQRAAAVQSEQRVARQYAARPKLFR